MPPLRFPEFTKEWKKIVVSDLLDFYSTNSLSWEQLEYDSEQIQNLHYGLIHVGLPTSVSLKSERLPNIKKSFIPRNYELCKAGDVAFADASEDTNDVAKAVEFVELAGKKVVCGLHTIHGRDNHNLTIVGYKGYAFASPQFHNQIRRIAQGTKIFSVSSKNFSECSISIPSKEEQSKIALLFSLIDQRIATQRKLIEDLKLLKSAIYHQTFSRIKGSLLSLKEIAIIVKGKQINGTELFETGDYYVMNGGITPSGYYNEYNTPAETISISEGGNSCGFVQYNEVPFWSGGHCYTLHINEKKGIIERYLFHYLKYNEQSIMSLRIGSGLPNIQKKDLENFKVIIPDVKEQEKLSCIYDTLQQKENLELSILTQWQLQKEYLLRKMFI